MRIRKLNAMALAVRIAVVGACWGCGAGSIQTSPLVSVKGKVTYKGQPLAAGVIHFEPDGYGRPAEGKLQSDGTYVLQTYKEDGVVGGFHKVFISDADKKLVKDKAFKKYTQTGTSGLTADVTPEQTEFNFDLK